MKTAFFTISAKNYLAHSRTLLSSLQGNSMGADTFLFLVDDHQGFFDPIDEEFQIVPATELGLPQGRWFFFKYSVLELSTAIKPWCFEWLMARGYEKIVYLDPDIRVLQSFQPPLRRLDEVELLLTPHLLRPLDDELKPTEHEILQAGTFNLGFLALRVTDDSRRLISWWKSKLVNGCRSKPEDGLFVDQKWMDLAPSFVAKHQILSDPRYNVAYWNLMQRPDVQPVFFHFSGYDPRLPEMVSKHQNRVQWDDLGSCYQTEFLGYRKLLLENGFLTCQKWPYSYGFWQPDLPIFDWMRTVFWQAPQMVEQLEDPFSEEGRDQILKFWAEGIPNRQGKNSGLPRLVQQLYQTRPDLQAHFPSELDADVEDLLVWATEYAPQEHRIPEEYGEWLLAARRQHLQRQQVGDWTAETVPKEIETLFGQRSDLQQAFGHANSLEMLDWVLTAGVRELAFSPQLLRSASLEWHRRIAHLPLPERTKWRLRHAKASVAASQRGFDQKPLETVFSHVPLPPKSVSAKIEFATRPKNDRPFGVNLIGYLNAEMGVGESVRLAARSLNAAGVPVEMVGLAAHRLHRQQDQSVVSGTGERKFFCDLFHVNADETDNARALIEQGDRTQIGYWHWELDELPGALAEKANRYSELWTASEFCKQSFVKSGIAPVSVFGHGIEIENVAPLKHEHWGLPPNRFLFLTAFDGLSVIERKNPRGVLLAFRRVCKQIGHDQIGLVVKIQNAQQAELELLELKALGRGLPVFFVQETISREETYSLIEHCDALVSLHRSEGFGLMPAEAMYLGRPVIATAYSGNVDFMTDENSLLVDCSLRPVGSGSLPYSPYAKWAEPNLSTAAEHMRCLATSKELYRKMAEAGSRSIRHTNSPKVCGEKMLDHLRRLRA
jgi:glycosyltransferase involved in cell wall biosynthesis